jgi:hypothetical protein
MIPKYIDLNSYVMVKFIDGTEVWAKSINRPSAKKDFDFVPSENTIILYEPLKMTSVHILDQESETEEYNEICYVPERYFAFDINPFMEIDVNKILTISNLDESATNHYSSCLDYLELVSGFNYMKLEESTEYIETELKEFREISNLEKLEEFDESLATMQ